MPFYGGAKGSILRFVKNKNGSLTTQVSPITGNSAEVVEGTASDTTESPGFADNLLKIQQAASQLVTIQQLVKASGKITEEEKQTYAENLDTLGKAAQELAKINDGAQDDDFRRLITGK